MTDRDDSRVGRSLASRPGLAALCSAAASNAGVGSVTVVVAGRQNSEGAVSHTDADASQAHALEFTLGEGPTTDALKSGTLALACDVTTATVRWPQFSPAAQRIGVRCISAVPLRIGENVLGSLTFYARDFEMVERMQRIDAYAIGESTLAALLDNSNVIDIAIDQPDAAADGSTTYRAVVHQATGMVAAQLGCDMAEALLRLRAYAFAQNESVEQIARAVVERRMKVSL